MKIEPIFSLNFKRRLKSSELTEYSQVLQQAKEKAAHGTGKSILIIPAMSLPQSEHNNTGVGNIASEEAQHFFEFAKKYWGINEIQLLPMGHFFEKHGKYAIYSGTSMDLGNHVINLEDYVTKNELNFIVKSNSNKDRVNFSNIVPLNSASEKVLKDVFKRMTPDIKKEFEQYKTEFDTLLEKKSLYRALIELNNTHDYHLWNELDKNLFNEDIVDKLTREKRIQEIKKLKQETIEFYKFKNFLAEKSFQKGKNALNKKGLKVDGDLICGFAFEEQWAYPKAFLKDCFMYSWGFPVLDVNSPDAEELLREKVNLYAKRYDNLRIDASWTYIAPTVRYGKSDTKYHIYNENKLIDIIDDEIKKVKGENYDLKNIMHEFSADKIDFNIYNLYELKPSIKKRVRVCTSDTLKEDCGSAANYIKHGWDENMFVLGATNHDSPNIEYNEEQAKMLSKLLKIPFEKLKTKQEFTKAKFAEPMRAKNNMLFFLQALGIKDKYQGNKDVRLNYTTKIPNDYEKLYFDALHKGFGFNPMDALEKQFIAQGLDKTNPTLFKKIVKFNKILAEKEKMPIFRKIAIGAFCVSLLSGFAYYMYFKKINKSTR